MYVRLNNRSMPTRVLVTDNEYTLSEDKASVLLAGSVDDDGNFVVGPVASKVHALHVQMNPELGSSLQIITPDDGPVELAKPTKSKLPLVEGLFWTHRIFFVRVDLLPQN